MGLKKEIAKYLANTVLANTLVSAGQKIGEAIGTRIGAKIYTPPKPDEKKPEEPKDGAQKTP